jgi:hypothetical protein
VEANAPGSLDPVRDIGVSAPECCGVCMNSAPHAMNGTSELIERLSSRTLHASLLLLTMKVLVPGRVLPRPGGWREVALGRDLTCV